MIETKEQLLKVVEQVEAKIQTKFLEIEKQCERNSAKVLAAFHEYRVTDAHFASTSGYGYGDMGRDSIEQIFARVLGTEDALVRAQMISGSHALTVTFFALLRPGDTLLSITGKPYDTLDEVIGITENASSLRSFGVNFEQIDLINDDFDYATIEKTLKEKKIKVIEIQRSKGYSTRKSILINKVKKIINFIKQIDPNVIVMVDNCYCEMVSDMEPTAVGADIMVGSLIKNLGGGIAPNGAYIAGRKDLVELCAERLTLPGEGREVGPTLGINKSFLQGLFFAPSVIASALKTAVFTSALLEELGFQVEPKWYEERADIVENIIFEDPEKLICYCQGIQMGSPIDSSAVPEPWNMPGYQDKVIMAAGTFTQGSSIELSCDGPIRAPFIAYQQGGLTYEYGKLGVLSAVEQLLKLK